MSKKIAFLVLPVLMLYFMPMSAWAAETAISYEQNDEAEVGVTGLFDSSYVVISEKVSARTGPGESYDVTCIIYKGSVISVSSISNGWAKFKLKGQWNYLPADSIEKKK